MYQAGLQQCHQRQRNARGRRLKMADDHADDVTRSVFYGGDVIDDVSGGVTNHSGAGLVVATDQMTSGCLLYKFVVDCINGLVCVLGLIGNLIAFVVFYKDTMKTSTSFLFQVIFIFGSRPLASFSRYAIVSNSRFQIFIVPYSPDKTVAEKEE